MKKISSIVIINVMIGSDTYAGKYVSIVATVSRSFSNDS